MFSWFSWGRVMYLDHFGQPKQLIKLPPAKDVKGLWEQLDRDGSGAIGIEAQPCWVSDSEKKTWLKPH